MDIQNFQFIQSFSKKQKKLDALEKRQASLLSILKNEYENLKELHKPRFNPREKFDQFQNLKKSYTFKLPETKEKTVNEERFKNGWLQKSPIHLTPRVHELQSCRNKMIQSGNSFSKKNLETFERLPIKRTASAPTQLELKQEMLVRRMEFGNFCSSQFVKKYAAKRSATQIDIPIQSKQLKDVPKTKRLKEADKVKKNLLKSQCGFDDKIYNENHEKLSKTLINEIFEPNIHQMEVSYGDAEKIYRSTESVDIGQLLDAIKEVKSKVSEVIQEEMIDYGTIDDAIMSVERKSDDEEEVNEAKSPTTTQIECFAQSKMDESRMKIEDESGDYATASNASIKCSRSLMSINRCSFVELGNENRSVEEQTDSPEDSDTVESSTCSQTHQENCLIQTPQKVDKFTSAPSNPLNQQECKTDNISSEPQSCSDKNSSAVETSESIVMKLRSALVENSSIPFINDISLARCRSGKLCEHQHSSDNANSSKNADNRESLPSHQQECKSIRTMSTFICGREIDVRKMESQRRRTDGEDIDIKGDESIAESPSVLSSRSSAIVEVFKHMERLD